tara:strand:+ start:2041 stop:2304 length:264 start_codon:yes stop_codon:yes gene_type:complete
MSSSSYSLNETLAQQTVIKLPCIMRCLEQDEFINETTTLITKEEKLEFIKEITEETMEELKEKAEAMFWELFEDRIYGYMKKEDGSK